MLPLRVFLLKAMKGIRSLILLALLAALVISLVGCSAPTSDTSGEDGTDLYYWDETELIYKMREPENGKFDYYCELFTK